MRGRAPLASILAVLVAGCGATGIANSVVIDMDRVRSSADVQESARLAPQEFALAENERALARKAAKDGDETADALYAAQAIASYTDAVVLARLARATVLSDQASSDLAREQARAQKLGAERASAEQEADELEKKLKIAQEALTPTSSGRADPEREGARLIAARALAAQARLLCGAARLLSPSLDGLAALDKDVDALDAQLEKAGKGGGAAPIDAAARTRAACLGVLTRARRTSDASPSAEPDTLLSELSSSSQFEPSRDERGVVVVLRDAFTGTTLTPAATKQLAELGRVAAAHPAFAVQVVLHDATAPSATEAQADALRAQAAAAALVGTGSQTRIKAETAGARAPLVDPQDGRHRGRNARLEVVFVSPGG